MKKPLEDALALMWEGRDGESVDQTLEAYGLVCRVATKGDIPRLLDFLSDDVGFWLRELLMIPVLEVGGASYIVPVLDALRINDAEGHDSDSLGAALMDYVEMNPAECRPVLEPLRDEPDSKYVEDAVWLLEYCDP